MVTSNIEPQNVGIDFINNGIATIRVRWEITSEQKPDEMGNTYTSWTYQERRIEWVLPQVYESLSAVRAYLDDNYESGENILNWSKASYIRTEGDSLVVTG